ncbi:winged helix-turn-helix transcriptional regulator [Candidatus Saccharibacteria bacterium]|jgi:vacuolar-type H+-ATPase subunit I/STV1|nr:MAG: winged helix-turn-helix transcriptional regulator [Candidatus Saccharibacteria bacterium]
MIEQLFGSKTRVKLLYLFYGNPERSFYVREITRKIDEQINSVRRELSNLLSVGLISSDTAENRLYYQVNKDYEFYKSLNAIFGSAVSVPDSEAETSEATKELGEELAAVTTTSNDARKWRSVGNVDAVVYSGHLTRDETAPIDVLVVGDVNPTKLANLVAEMEKSEGVELRYASFTADEALYRSQVRDRFWSQLEESKKQIVMDKNKIFSK